MQHLAESIFQTSSRAERRERMLEGQTFPEVFPDYTVPDNLKYILSNAVVSKVVMKQQKRQLVIH